MKTINNELNIIKDNFCKFDCPYREIEQDLLCSIEDGRDEIIDETNGIYIELEEESEAIREQVKDIKENLEETINIEFDKLDDAVTSIYRDESKCSNLCPLNNFVRRLEDEKIL